MKNTTTDNKHVAKNNIFYINRKDGRSVKRPRVIKAHVQGYAGQTIIHIIICMKRYINLIQNRLIFKNYYEYPNYQYRLASKNHTEINIK